MAVSRVKTWAAEILTAADLNAEFDNILNNGEDLGWPATVAKDLNGNELILDADADSSITADTDDRIDFRAQAFDMVRFDGSVAIPVNGFDLKSSAATNDISIEARGADTDISVNIVPKGSGTLKVGGTTISAAASQAEMETATDLTTFASPGRVHNHPGVAKFWVSFNASGVIQASYNVTSVARNSAGDYTVTIDTDFSSAEWCAQVMGQDATDLSIKVTVQTAGTIRVVYDSRGAGTPVDVDRGYIAGFGDQ